MRLFRDIGKLSPKYIPSRLPHREEDISRLLSFFPEDMFLPITVQVVGPAGCGKTSVSILSGKKLFSERNVYPIYVNLKIAQNKHFIYSMFIQSLRRDISTRSLSADEILYKFLKYLDKTNRRVLIILDEIGYYVGTKDTSIIYDITRLNEFPNIDKMNVIGVILISRNTNWQKLLDESERSSLGQLILQLKKYSKEELLDILEYRCSEALKPGKISIDVLEYIADTTVNEADSDVRYALDIIYYSGLLAERRGSQTITFEHVREVLSTITSPTITNEDLMNLNDTERNVLLAVALALKSKKEAYVSFTEVYSEFKEIYSKPNLEKLENNLQSLEDKGVIVVRGFKRIGLNVPTERLIPFLERLIERIKETY